MRPQYKLRTLLLLPAIVGVTLVWVIIPTRLASSFVQSFEGKANKSKLHWIDEDLRVAIHRRTEDLGLAPASCASYRAELQPLELADLLLIRRRVELLHNPNWAPLVTGGQEDDPRIVNVVLGESQAVELSVGPFWTQVHK